MIEMRRERLGLPNMVGAAADWNGSISGQTHSLLPNGTTDTNSNLRLRGSQKHYYGATRAIKTAVANSVLQEDEKMRHFLHLISTRSHIPSTQNSNGVAAAARYSPTGTPGAENNHQTDPTVPISLSRRILHRQGTGYLDETVPAIVSGAADRFLATVLHQSIVCQNRRLTGERLMRREKLERMKCRKRRMAECRARKRRKEKLENALEKRVMLKGSVERGGGFGVTRGKSRKDGSSVGNGKNKGSNKANAGGDAALANTVGDALLMKTDFTSETDSLNEEESYYESNYKDNNSGSPHDESESGSDWSYKEEELDDDEDLDEVLQLRDCVQPLEAWGMSLTGKLGLNTIAEPDDAALDTDGELDDASGSTMLEQENEYADEDDDKDDGAVGSAASTNIKVNGKSTVKRKPTLISPGTQPNSSNGKIKRSNASKGTTSVEHQQGESTIVNAPPSNETILNSTVPNAGTT